ncbi:hypothetical protein G7Y89_g10991 [Cudoniella acicularis]|uniref:Heterokaryon incompatibility domain-containing protein n=1 Tax=Cudoniella acicularis TaxID=354080 RepID=A0A8H4RD75_9HELO|nr:hypothetical protein G7Y89_g10991 [Cudoniella acicularis]
MDLLPYPTEARLPPIEVPYICADFVDELEFDKGFAIVTHLAELPDCQAWYPVDRDAAVRKAQAHLFFGLLYDAFWDAPPPLEDLLRHSDRLGTTVVSLQRLSEERFLRVLDRDALSVYLQPCLETLHRHLRYIRPLSDMGELIGLSVETLLWMATGSVSPYHDHRLLQGRMLSAGWCPYWTKAYCEQYSSPVLYYLSGMDRSRHEQHPRCTANGPCKVYDVDNETYATRHAPHCARQPSCPFVGSDLEELERIILKGGIPLVRFRETPVPVLGQSSKAKSVVKIDIVEHTFGRPFIAVSHVWAGGMGNTSANKLPQCQIDYLFQYARQCQQRPYGAQAFFRGEMPNIVDKVDEIFFRMIQSGISEDMSTVHIWVDTLCIPADDRLADLGGLKEMCIEKMAQIYALAIHTIVIDHKVRDLSVKAEKSAMELAVELATCPWMGRSWTFQEACLSRDFSFALRDGLVNPRKWRKDKALPTFRHQLSMEILAASFDDMPDVLNQAVFEAESANTPSAFIEVWNELAVRRTTYPDDLHGILAVLLGLSPLEIFQRANGTKQPPSERMMAIIKSQQFLPLAMLFMPHPEGTVLCENHESQAWLPQFPTGRLNMDFGQMCWTTDGAGGLEFRLEDANSSALIVDSIKLGKTNNLSMEEQKHASSEGIDFLVTLGHISISFTLRFKVDAEEPLSVNPSGPSEKEDFRWVDDVTCFVDCDSSTWPTPLNRRRMLVPRQSSLSFPIATFIFLYWTIYSIRLFNHPGWANYVYQYSKFNLRTFKLPIVGPCLRIISKPEPFIYSRWFFNPICIVGARVFYFFALDYFPLEAVAERVRYERLAHSFELVPTPALSHSSARTMSRRLREEPLYQFKSRWPIGITLALMTFGQEYFWMGFSQLVWKPEPEPWAFHTVVDLSISTAIVGEVVGRVVVEWVWRWFRLDLQKPTRKKRYWDIGF